MKTLAILYICTGPYAVFWHDFYPNFKANFLPDCDRTFYVFTDAAHIDYEDAPDVRRIYQKALPWPQSTMLRFDAFLGQADALQGYDYLFFANANLHCTRVIRADELLPDPAAGQSLTAVCHLPYYGKNPIFHPYDRSGKSRASIPYSCGQYYVAGGLNGGTAAAYLALCACVQFTPQAGLLWMMALVLERALSGYAVAAFPMAKNTGLAHTFASAADRATVRRVLALLAAVLCCAMLALGGWALVLAALAVLWRYHAVACKQFGGITGDLAGWFLQKAELWMLAALCACQWGGLL